MAEKMTYHMPKNHPVICKMKKGGKVRLTLSRATEEPDEQGYPMTEEMAEALETPPGVAKPAPQKKRTAMQYLKDKKRGQ